MQDNRSGLAVLYAAKSSPDEHGSIAGQLRDARAYAKGQGLEVIAEYSEEDVTAYKGDRGPELAKALAHAESAGAMLIAQHSDRLARGDGKQARHLVEIALWAIKADVAIHCVQDPSTFENLVMAVVMGERNMEDSRRKSLAVRAGLARRRRERGLPNGGAAPFGYMHRRNEADERGLVIDEVLAPFARRIYVEYLAGVSYMAIAQGLTADGVPTRKGGPWNHCTVRRILMNPIYAGLIRDGEEFLAGRHEAIVERERWEKAQALREAKARTCARGRLPAGRHLFRKGFLKCGICGGSIGPLTARNRYGVYERYSCITRRNDPSACTMRSLNRDRVDGAVYAYFEGLGLDVGATKEQLAGARERELAEVRDLLASAEQETQAARERLERIKRDYLSGQLTAVEWRELKAELEPELSAAQAEEKRLRGQLEEAESESALSKTTSELLSQLSEIRAEITKEVTDSKEAAAVRAALMRLFDGFVLHRGSPRHEKRESTKVAYWLEPVLGQRQMDGLRTKLRPPGGRDPFREAKNNSDAPMVWSKRQTVASTGAGPRTNRRGP